jgi:hypothetical protein
MRFLLTAEEFGAAEALRIGLVQEVVPAEAHVQRAADLAHLTAQQAPLGVQATLASARAGLGRGPDHRPQRVRPAPARHELQIPVHQPLAQAITDLARPRHETHKTREAAHLSTIPVCDARTQERHGSPVY